MNVESIKGRQRTLLQQLNKNQQLLTFKGIRVESSQGELHCRCFLDTIFTVSQKTQLEKKLLFIFSLSIRQEQPKKYQRQHSPLEEKIRLEKII